MIVSDLSQEKNAMAGVVAFGFFDAIHIGHQAVIEKAIELAEQYGVPSSVFTFENNIYPLIGIDKEPIYSFSERLHFIEKTGVKNVFYMNADEDFLSMSPDRFLDYLSEHLSIVGISCGSDYTFGKDGLGTPLDLIDRFGGIFSVLPKWMTEVPPDSFSEVISSEAVKHHLSKGNLGAVRAHLNRHFSIIRPVLEGRKDGSRIGFPTINQSLGTLPLKRGVYFTNVVLRGARFPSLTNVGAHPTFGDRGENLETFILDFYGDLYDRVVEVEFLDYHREIKRFDSEASLIKAIDEDVDARMKYKEVTFF